MFGTSSFHLRHIRCFRLDANAVILSRYRRNIVIFRTSRTNPTLYAFHLKFSDLLLSVRKALDNNSNRILSLNSRTKCWNCNKNLETLKFTCLNCGVLQHPDPDMNYFELLDLPRHFDLNVDDISSKYKALQMIFHPDKYVQKSKEEINISDAYSRLINKAYSTLRNPLLRGLYILKLNGVDADDDSVKMDQKFLMDIMEKNEELEKIKDAKALKQMHEANTQVILDFVSVVSKAFQTNDLVSAKEALMRMKYFVNIENEIKKKKSEMGVVD